MTIEVKKVETRATRKIIEVSTPTKTASIFKSPAASGANTGAICTITTIDVWNKTMKVKLGNSPLFLPLRDLGVLISYSVTEC